MLTARALAAEDADRDNAKAFALEAAKLAPTLVPAAALAGRMLAEGGELRKAARIVDKAWRANPHPDLAQAYADLRFGDAARDRLKRIEALAKKAPGHIEGALALRARRDRCAGIRQGARRARALSRGADQARRAVDGRAGAGRAQRRRPRPRMDGARAQRRARSGMDRRRLRVRSLAAGLAGERPARRLRMARAAHRHRQRGAGDRAGAVSRRAARERAERSAKRGAPHDETCDSMPRRSGRAAAAARGRACAGAPPAAPPPKPEPVIPLVHAPDDPGPDARRGKRAARRAAKRRLAEDFRVSAGGAAREACQLPSTCIIAHEL